MLIGLEYYGFKLVYSRPLPDTQYYHAYFERHLYTKYETVWIRRWIVLFRTLKTISDVNKNFEGTELKKLHFRLLKRERIMTKKQIKTNALSGVIMWLIKRCSSWQAVPIINFYLMSNIMVLCVFTLNVKLIFLCIICFHVFLKCFTWFEWMLLSAVFNASIVFGLHFSFICMHMFIVCSHHK